MVSLQQMPLLQLQLLFSHWSHGKCPGLLAASLVLPFLQSHSPEREGKRKRRGAEQGRQREEWAVGELEAAWGLGEARWGGAGADSLVGHLCHLLEGAVAGHQEVLCVLLHPDGLQPLGHRAEGHAL